MRRTIVILAGVILSGLIGCTSSTPADLSDIAGWRGAAVNSPETFRFVILSDRTGGHIPGLWAQAVKETNRLKPDFVITIGDQVEGYTDDEDKVRRQWKEFDAMTRKLDAPFFYCPGNHDVIPDACRKIYTELHGIDGKAWYSFDYRGCHFLVADSSAMIGKDKALANDQWAWLKKDLAGAKDSLHTFIFVHHPLLFYKARVAAWKRLLAMVNPKKTTVFSGHWHSPLSYDLQDGVAYYVLSATAAGSGGAPKNPNRMLGEFQSYAHVVVDKGKPTISIIPLGEVLPHDFIDRSAIYQLNLPIWAVALGSTTTGGGEVTVDLPSPTAADATCTLTWSGKDEWFVGGLPKSETLTIPASAALPDKQIGKSVKRTWRIKPTAAGLTPPVLTVRYEVTAEGRTMDRTRELPLQIVATLTARRVKGVTIDGKLDDWSDAPAHVTNTRSRVKYKPDAWSGPADCSMTTRMGYDDKSIYLAIDVTDDVIVTGGRNPWERDGVMVFWDQRGTEARDGKFTDPCRELMISVSSDSEKAKVEAWPKDAALVKASQVVCRQRKGGYTVELAIPFSAIGKDFKPAAGGKSPISLEVIIYDRDKTAEKETMSCLVLSGTDRAYRTTIGYAVVTFR